MSNPEASQDRHRGDIFLADQTFATLSVSLCVIVDGCPMAANLPQALADVQLCSKYESCNSGNGTLSIACKMCFETALPVYRLQRLIWQNGPIHRHGSAQLCTWASYVSPILQKATEASLSCAEQTSMVQPAQHIFFKGCLICCSRDEVTLSVSAYLSIGRGHVCSTDRICNAK